MDKNDDSTITTDVSRRAFTAGSVAAATLAAAAGPAAAADVVETDVTIKTPDGNADAAYFHPATGKHPAVIIWTDIFGLRPSFRAMGRRLAAEGYTVLVPNPFYRTAKAPVVVDASTFDFNDPASRAKTAAWTGPINVPGAIEKDAGAYIAWLDSQKETDTAKKIGTQGYCMGGPLVFKTAALSPRVGAGATFHGGGLVTPKPDSPHTLAPKITASMMFLIAASDDMQQPTAKDTLKQSFPKAHVEVLAGTFHGWTVPDMPPQADGKPTYDKPQAEHAWTKLVALYKKSLA